MTFIVAYTDGACVGNPGPMGLGVVLVLGTQHYELSEYLGKGTNNIAELTAILRAAEAAYKLLQQNKYPIDTLVKIHTDSQYAIGILSKNWQAKANVELVEKIKLILKHLRVEFIYVRGHSGIELNERADMLATSAANNRETKPWSTP